MASIHPEIRSVVVLSRDLDEVCMEKECSFMFDDVGKGALLLCLRILCKRT